ncbi:putative RING-H2 finger protein ATL21A [Senna tora]|uniref:RING-type E3 ubiquitin transferase n=1 Tax=Senna tora TaxID=362788 RepID=A0A834WP40_9FABA|nr:putative RING-H2 finger protein ATL21A [Senna tora]
MRHNVAAIATYIIKQSLTPGTGEGSYRPSFRQPTSQAQAQLCQTTSCGQLSIDFPFQLVQSNNQSARCGYPGFELSCTNHTQALLSLPSWSDVVVTSISLENQQVWINDPNGCLPKRFIDTNFSLQGSPFQLGDYYNLLNYSFYNCPSNLTTSTMLGLDPISCLSSSNDVNNSVIAVLSDPPFSIPWISSCRFVDYAFVPVPFTDRVFWRSFDTDIMLQWDQPDCGDCVARGGRCGFSSDTSARSIGCYDLPTQAQGEGSGGLSKKAKYGVAFGVGIPGLVGVMVLACIFWGRMKTQHLQRRQLLAAHTEFSTSIIPHRTVLVMGLDGAIIEKYPKTQLEPPFYLRGTKEPNCGLPGFELFCNEKNQTILSLPKGGDLLVKGISPEQQKLWVNDPQDCLLARFVHGDIDFEESPFHWSSIYLDPFDLNFLNCTTNNLTDSFPLITHKIPCLVGRGGVNHSVVAVWRDPYTKAPPPTDPTCWLISTTSVPVSVNTSKPFEEFWTNFYSDLELEWGNHPPGCGDCDPFCKSFKGWDICGRNTPRNGKLGELLGLGVAGMVFFVVVGITQFLGVPPSAYGRAGSRGDQIDNGNTELTNMGGNHHHDVIDVRMGAREGLDGKTIEEFYPKVQVSESGRLPKVGDNVCSICLCEYEPMDTLRTIPLCDHYFHAHCIDGWLKMNATCPLCRN